MRGDKEKAVEWMQKAANSGWTWYDDALKSPLYEVLRDESRFQNIIAEVKAKVDVMRRRVEEMEKEWEQ
jgi:hypothetical protein